MSASASSLGAPGQIIGLTPSTESATTVTLAWSAALPAPSSYMVQYRVSGTAGWSTAPSVTTAGCTVTGLLSATSYDFVVSAANVVGIGSPSAIVSAVTFASLSPSGQVTGLTTSSATASGVSLAWSTSGSAGSSGSYTVQYCISGTAPWSIGASGLTSTSFTIAGLLPATSYNFQVCAVTSQVLDQRLVH
jgi:hypothetical protein